MNMLRIGIVLAFALAAAGSAHAANAGKLPPALNAASNKAFLDANAKRPGTVVRPSGLQYRILHNGFGRRPGPDDYVTVNYTGALINGEVFDGTEPGMPARFKVKTLIAGWAEALKLMRTGDHWQLVIPAELGYGTRGAGSSIAPNQTLVFDLELLKVVSAKMRQHAQDENPDKFNDNEDLGPDDDE
jgi:FKBP-type peptidyl-prolyl cis-trans isomerase